jgi:squalene-hopene/tetraprenyl-beta-curcumene cyclase
MWVETSSIVGEMGEDRRVRVSDRIGHARRRLAAQQRQDGSWLFELEPDVTISAEYLLLRHYLGDLDPDVEHAVALHIRSTQSADGGWPLFHAGESDISATVKAYYALKLAGDDPDAPHMRRARSLVIGRGGAVRANVFTRIGLALFGQMPWHAVPAMPVEIMLLPTQSPFHIEKISYWSRTVLVPLLVLMALKPRARNPLGIEIPELFVTSQDRDGHRITNASGTALGSFFVQLDRLLRLGEPFFPGRTRQRAIAAAVAFAKQRLNGEDGLGAIFPAMANAVMMFDALGYDRRSPEIMSQRTAIDNLLCRRGEALYCQPCESPVWDTALALHALMEAGEPPDGPIVERALDWLLSREITDMSGDWRWRRPSLAPSGWAFQRRNDHYPDLDDTAVVVMALHRADPVLYRAAIDRAARWVIGMQSMNGGWAAFDANNTYAYLNAIPFADHGALVDPPTVDVTARCLGMLAQLGYERDEVAVRKAISFLESAQEQDGSWYGRWGVNYVYGTWSALTALNAVGYDPLSTVVRRAVAWLKARQNDDGGWGESCASYRPDMRQVPCTSTPSQTAWAVLALMAAFSTARWKGRAGARICGRASGSRASSTSSTTAIAPISLFWRSRVTRISCGVPGSVSDTAFECHRRSDRIGIGGPPFPKRDGRQRDHPGDRLQRCRRGSRAPGMPVLSGRRRETAGELRPCRWAGAGSWTRHAHDRRRHSSA